MKVSIVTPSFNQGQFLGRTLESVAIQRVPGLVDVEIEHMVFDGGSTDDTVAVLEAFRPAVRWVSRPDKGQAHAVNLGIQATDGELIGWLNSDDIYYPGAVARVAAYLREHPDIDVVYGQADHIDLEDRAFEAYPCEPWSLPRLHETCFLCQPAVFFRRRVVEEYGLLDERLHFCMDYEYWLRLGRTGVRFGYLEEKLAGSRFYAANKTLGSRGQAHAETNDVFLRMLGRVPDRWLFNYAHAVVEREVDRRERPRWFRVRIAASALGAALRWNRGVTPAMLRTALSWLLR